MNNIPFYICFISTNYPTPQESMYAFVEQLVNEVACQGNRCTVISPQSITRVLLGKGTLQPKYQHLEVRPGVFVDLYRPYMYSLSRLTLGSRPLTPMLFVRCVNKQLEKLKIHPDAIYGHFWTSAFAGFDYAKKHNIPLFNASGEAEIMEKDIDQYQQKRQMVFDYLYGTVAVSTKTKEESIKWGLVDEGRVEVFPNSINTNRFHLKDKKACREALGIKDDDFLVGFIGRFEHRKGTLRVSDALKKLNNPKIKSFFIGEAGDQKPDCDGVIYWGKVKHEKIADYLNAADVFVLPTLNEGCCNAIIEAMACGLPIISSNLSFNDDVLTPANSIRIDPMNVDEIAKAIDTLYKDPERRASMALAAVETAKDLNIQTRASRIIDFIKRKIAERRSNER